MGKNVTVQRVLSILLHRLHLIIASGIIFALLFFMYSSFIIKPTYSTSTMIFIQNYNKSSVQKATQPASQPATTPRNGGQNDVAQNNNEVAQKIFSSDISGSANLAKICVTFFQNSDEITALYNGCAVSFSVEENTFYITISVSGTEAQKCANVANQIAEKCQEVYHKGFSYGQIGTIRTAKEPSAPVSPNKMRNTLIGAAIGIILACLIAILLDLIDTTIKSDDDLAEIYKVPVFAEIPDFGSLGR